MILVTSRGQSDARRFFSLTTITNCNIIIADCDRPAETTGTFGGRTRNHRGVSLPKTMTPTTSPNLGTIHPLLAERGYEVSEPAPDTITIRELDSGVSLQAVLEGDILFPSLPCTTVARTPVAPELMAPLPPT